jgi:hypothetical protein
MKKLKIRDNLISFYQLTSAPQEKLEDLKKKTLLIGDGEIKYLKAENEDITGYNKVYFTNERLIKDLILIQGPEEEYQVFKFFKEDVNDDKAFLCCKDDFVISWWDLMKARTEFKEIKKTRVNCFKRLLQIDENDSINVGLSFEEFGTYFLEEFSKIFPNFYYISIQRNYFDSKYFPEFLLSCYESKDRKIEVKKFFQARVYKDEMTLFETFPERKEVKLKVSENELLESYLFVIF